MPRRSQAYHVQLTTRERDTLLSHVEPHGALDDIFAKARVAGPLVSLELGADRLDEFFRHLEATAQFAQNESAMDLLDQVLRRLEAGFAGTADPGWHMLRPATAREQFTAKQGQYLAFIHLFTRLHRRAPSHADIQEYFRTSPPVVNETLKALRRRGFIAHEPGTARSIRVLLPPHAIPELE
jgi:DNA-binding MarR family transcriptional regulator